MHATTHIRADIPGLAQAGSVLAGGDVIVHVYTDKPGFALVAGENGVMHPDTPLSTLALDVCERTSAAHVAWWSLYAAPRHAEEVRVKLVRQVGASRSELKDILERACTGLGYALTARERRVLRDYALLQAFPDLWSAA